LRACGLVALAVSMALGGCGGADAKLPSQAFAGAAGAATAGAATGGRESAAPNAAGNTSGSSTSGSGGSMAAAGGPTGTAGSSTDSVGGTTEAAAGTPSYGTSGAAAGGSGGSGADGASGGPSCPGLICEDFEGGAIDPQKWQTLTKGGTAAVQTQRVAHGSYALQLHGLASGSDDWAILVVQDVPSALKGNTSFGRMSVYWGAEAAVSLHTQFPFAGRNGIGGATGPAPFSKLRYLEVGSYFGGWQLGMDLLDVSPSVEDVSHPSGKWPTNKWFCMEWKFEDQPDRVTLWLNGTQIGTLDGTNAGSNGALYQGKSSGIIGGFDTFGVGFHDWHPAKAFDVYYDDVVLGVERIGCPSP